MQSGLRKPPRKIVRLLGMVLLAAWTAPLVGRAAEPSDSAEPIKAFCIDFNWGPGGVNAFAGPGLWADASPPEHIAWYQALGANVVQTFAVSCNGYAWYKGGFVPQQPGLKYDFLTTMVELGHQRKMRVMGYFCVGANTRWAQEHPRQSYGTISSPHIPFTAEYLDYLSASIEDALKKTGMDGFMIDWVWNPGDLQPAPLGWLDCEQQMFRELLGRPFPGKDKITPEIDLAFRRKAIDRCWNRLHEAAKRANPNCIIWLSCCNVDSPVVAGSRMFQEVDWLMNEATDPKALATVRKMKGPHTRLVQCVVGWGDRHDAKAILTGADKRDFGIYGFAKPGENSLPLPIAQYKSRPIGSFQGNDRNIAVLARYFNDQPLDVLSRQQPDGRIALLAETANIDGNSPVIEDGQIGRWQNGRDSVGWRFDVTRPGTFEVILTYACAKDYAGSGYRVLVGDKSFQAVTLATGAGWRDYVPRSLGTVALDRGRHTLTIQPAQPARWQPMSVKSLVLTPVERQSPPAGPSDP